MLVVIACDGAASSSLTQAARAYLAWRSISDDREALNLDMAQARETDQNLARAEETLKVRVQEAYSWLLCPAIDLATGSIELMWDVDRIAGGGEDAPRKAARKLLSNEGAITQWAPQLLTMELDRVLWHDAERRDIQVRQLWEYLCSYCYLPRLSQYSVLEDAILQGSESSEYFGIASGFSEGRYLDLSLGKPRMRVNPTDLLVKRAVAADQLDREEEERTKAKQQRQDREASLAPVDGEKSGLSNEEWENTGGEGDSDSRHSAEGSSGGGKGFSLPKSFTMSTKLDSTRVSRDIRTIMEEIVSQLSALDDADIELRLDVHASSSSGIPVPAQRAISENCNTLNISDYRFDG